MAENVVNLRMVRKRKLRAKKDKQAEQNRISFGRTKSEKKLTSRLNEKTQQELDLKKLSKPNSEQ